MREYMKEQNIITIDTTSNEIIKVGLKIDGKEDLLSESHDKKKAQIVLPLIEKLLESHQLQLADISGIEVNLGPGSFTGVRVGVAIANTLGYILRVPINGLAVGKLVEPVYS